MATPPNSESIFLSSSPIRYPSYPSGPSEEVEVLLAQARGVTLVDPLIQDFLATNHDAFFSTFTRQINLIRSRSQAFQDCHITVFDKVLLELTRNGDDLEDPTAIQYFCEEFLAIPADAPSTQKTSALADTLMTTVHTAPAEVATPPETHHGSISAGDVNTASPKKKSLFGHELNPRSVLFTKIASDISPVMARLWMVYEQAKKEFLAATEPGSMKQQTTAKFLRDTAENTIHYLRGKNVDGRLLAELEATLDAAERIAMTHHGGKKRKFDHPRPISAVERRSPPRLDKTDSSDMRRRDCKRDREPRGTSSSMQGEFPGHTRALVQHSRVESVENDHHYRRTTVLELFPERSRRPEINREEKARKQRVQPGRGHSNIPFGYSRPVDSYQP